MFGLFVLSDSLVGTKIPENSKRAVEALFASHYNARRVSQSHWGDDRYIVELRDGRCLNVRPGTGYTLMNRPYTYIRSVD